MISLMGIEPNVEALEVGEEEVSILIASIFYVEWWSYCICSYPSSHVIQKTIIIGWLGLGG
jgi:hypothetical protein